MSGRQKRREVAEVRSVRTVGFQDAVADLGTHMLCGNAVPYSPQMVRGVLNGRFRSERLLRRIAERRPDLFGLRYVCEGVKAWWAENRPGAVARSPQGAVARSPQGAVARSPRGAVARSPQGAVARSPQGAVARSPRKEAV